VKLLLAKDGVDPNSKGNIDRTLLLWAVEEAREVVVELLLANGGVERTSAAVKREYQVAMGRTGGQCSVNPPRHRTRRAP
jgi:hypothetical protein